MENNEISGSADSEEQLVEENQSDQSQAKTNDTGFSDDDGDSGEHESADGIIDGIESYSRVMELEEELRLEREKHLRLLAEFDNYKKQVQKQRSEMLKYQGQPIIIDLLDIIDNFDLSVKHEGADPESFKQGIRMIHKSLNEILAKWGINGESCLGEPFNPSVHNAIGSEPSEEYEPGTIIRELKKPFHYKDRLLRVGEVIVASEPSEV